METQPWAVRQNKAGFSLGFHVLHFSYAKCHDRDVSKSPMPGNCGIRGTWQGGRSQAKDGHLSGLGNVNKLERGLSDWGKFTDELKK